jgi:hypothetical protein
VSILGEHVPPEACGIFEVRRDDECLRRANMTAVEAPVKAGRNNIVVDLIAIITATDR